MRAVLVVGGVLGLLGVLPAGSAAAGAAVGPGTRTEAPSGWRLPLDGPLHVVRGFAPPERRWEPGHRGVDLAGPAGAPVRAAGAGTVTWAGVLAGTGVVTVTHPAGTRTTYQPVTATVAVGERVEAGAALGRLGLAGGHCLPSACLHWGRLRGDVYLDPLLLVRAGTARLLPVWDGRDRAPPARLAAGRVRGDAALEAAPEAVVEAVAPDRTSPPGGAVRSDPVAASGPARGPVGIALLLVLAAAVALRPGRPLRPPDRRRRQSSAGSSAASRV